MAEVAPTTVSSDPNAQLLNAMFIVADLGSGHSVLVEWFIYLLLTLPGNPKASKVRYDGCIFLLSRKKNILISNLSILCAISDKYIKRYAFYMAINTPSILDLLDESFTSMDSYCIKIFELNKDGKKDQIEEPDKDDE